MVVEDDHDIRQNMEEFLDGEGYKVLSARDGQEAIEILTRASELPILILLDLMMPRMDGLAFRTAQEKDARLAVIPVLLMTAHAQPEVEKLRLGTAGVVKKPIDIEALSKLLESF